MEKDNFRLNDNFTLFGFKLNDKHQFYIYLIALFGLPIGLSYTSQYLYFLSSVLPNISLSEMNASDLIQFLFAYSPLLIISILVQLGIMVISLYIIIRVRSHKKEINNSGISHKILGFSINEERQMILLGVSLFGIIMYSFYVLKGINSIIYVIQTIIQDEYNLSLVSLPQIIFKLVNYSFILILSAYILTKLRKFQNLENDSPKIILYAYDKKYINIILIFALIGVFASIFIYILGSISWIPLYVGSIIQLSEISHMSYIFLSYIFNLIGILIEIGRGFLILFVSIKTINNIKNYQER